MARMLSGHKASTRGCGNRAAGICLCETHSFGGRNGYATGMFGKWAGGYEGSESTPDKRGIDEYYGYICQFQAHL